MERAGQRKSITGDYGFKLGGFPRSSGLSAFNPCHLKDVIIFHKYDITEMNCFWPKFIKHYHKCENKNFTYIEEGIKCDSRREWYRNQTETSEPVQGSARIFLRKINHRKFPEKDFFCLALFQLTTQTQKTGNDAVPTSTMPSARLIRPSGKRGNWVKCQMGRVARDRGVVALRRKGEKNFMISMIFHVFHFFYDFERF